MILLDLELGRLARKCAGRSPIHREDFVFGRCGNMVLVALLRAVLGIELAAGEYRLAAASGSIFKQMIFSASVFNRDLITIRHGSYLHLLATVM